MKKTHALAIVAGAVAATVAALIYWRWLAASQSDATLTDHTLSLLAWAGGAFLASAAVVEIAFALGRLSSRTILRDDVAGRGLELGAFLLPLAALAVVSVTALVALPDAAAQTCANSLLNWEPAAGALVREPVLRPQTAVPRPEELDEFLQHGQRLEAFLFGTSGPDGFEGYFKILARRGLLEHAETVRSALAERGLAVKPAGDVTRAVFSVPSAELSLYQAKVAAIRAQAGRIHERRGAFMPDALRDLADQYEAQAREENLNAVDRDDAPLPPEVEALVKACLSLYRPAESLKQPQPELLQTWKDLGGLTVDAVRSAITHRSARVVRTELQFLAEKVDQHARLAAANNYFVADEEDKAFRPCLEAFRDALSDLIGKTTNHPQWEELLPDLRRLLNMVEARLQDPQGAKSIDPPGPGEKEKPDPRSDDPERHWTPEQIKTITREHYRIKRWNRVTLPLGGKPTPLPDVIEEEWRQLFDYGNPPPINPYNHTIDHALEEANKVVMRIFKQVIAKMLLDWRKTYDEVFKVDPKPWTQATPPPTAIYQAQVRRKVRSPLAEDEVFKDPAKRATVVSFSKSQGIELRHADVTSAQSTVLQCLATLENGKMLHEGYIPAMEAILALPEGKDGEAEVKRTRGWYGIFHAGLLEGDDPFWVLEQGLKGIPVNPNDPNSPRLGKLKGLSDKALMRNTTPDPLPPVASPAGGAISPAQKQPR